LSHKKSRGKYSPNGQIPKKSKKNVNPLNIGKSESQLMQRAKIKEIPK
jgi:hypothetical protein